MKELIRKDILKILQRLTDILEKKEEQDYIELKGLSNRTIHNSSIFQDEDSISIAVMVYAIAKMMDRGMSDRIYNMIFSKLISAKDAMEKSDQKIYRKEIKYLFKIISKSDEKLKLYVGDVISQAQMKKAGKIYQHGLSVGTVSDLMGISQWELLRYLGSTSVVEDEYDPKDIRKRLNFARTVFNA